jgi:hypothetical protein
MIFGLSDIRNFSNINVPSKEEFEAEEARKKADPYDLANLKTNPAWKPSEFFTENFPGESGNALRYQILAEGTTKADVWTTKQKHWKPGNYLGLGPMQLSNKDAQDKISKVLGYDISTQEGADRMLADPVAGQKAIRVWMKIKESEGHKFDTLENVHRAIAPGAERELHQRVARLLNAGISPTAFGLKLTPERAALLRKYDPVASLKMTTIDMQASIAADKAKAEKEKAEREKAGKESNKPAEPAKKKEPTPLFNPRK